MQTRLVTSIEIARLLKVTPSAVTNWRRRGSGPLPSPDFYYITAAGKKAPLWTIEQIVDVVESQLSEAHARLQEMRKEEA